MIRRLRSLGLTLALGIVLAVGTVLPAHASSFSPGLVMDDTIFSLSGAMTAAQIDSFLNGFAGSCISTNAGFSAPDPTGYTPSGGWTFGGNVSGGQVIYDTAQAYNINPQVLLVMLQKEQSLVSGGNGCATTRYAAATSYGCPGGATYNYSGVNLYSMHGSEVTSVSGSCVDTQSKVGFSQQLIRTAWDLKFSQERSEGNTSWAIIKPNWDNSDDLTSCYSGPMIQGTSARCPGNTPTYFDGTYTTLDGQSIAIATGATAAFYWYTPYVSSSQDIYNLFTSWFGGTISANYYQCHNATNVSGAATGESIIANRLNPDEADDLSLVVPNNTNSACVEVHTWANAGLQAWQQHTATNLPAINPANSEIISADLTGSGTDQLYLVEYDNTGSGMVEVHGWNATDQQWSSHVATNMPAVNPANAEVVAADPTGSGRDSLFLVEYNNTGSGNVEIHQWAPGEQQWVAHTATNLPAISDPSNVQVVAGDFYGNGQDEFALVEYSGTASGRIEVHIWTPGEQNWMAHIATNSATISHTTNDVIAADLNNSGQDQLYLVEYDNTGSGMVEVHGWAPGEQQWASHVATSAGEFSN